MKCPLVSIVIPVYNCEKYIKEAIDSILGQDYPRIELIVLDDGSTDASKSVIEGYPKPSFCRASYAKARITVRFLKYTLQECERLKKEIEELQSEVKEKGLTGGHRCTAKNIALNSCSVDPNNITMNAQRGASRFHAR